MLKERFGPAEAERFEAMKPLRDYIMAHYQIVGDLSSPMPKGHVLFVRK